MKTLINLDYIKLENRTLQALQNHCVDNNLDPTYLHIYYDDGELHVGFNDTPKTHITLKDANWIPANSDIVKAEHGMN